MRPCHFVENKNKKCNKNKTNKLQKCLENVQPALRLQTETHFDAIHI